MQIKRPPGYELFMAPLSVVLNPTEYERVQFAYFASKYGHEKKLRKNGQRFFDHPKTAAWIYIDELGGRDPRAIIVILLHDMQEDSYLLSPYRIALNFGPEIALDVRAVTKLPKGKETTEAYLGRVIVQGLYSILGKLFDRLHNARDLDGCTPDERARLVEETRRYHLPLLIPALMAHGEPWSTYAVALEQKLDAALDAVDMHTTCAN